MAWPGPGPGRPKRSKNRVSESLREYARQYTQEAVDVAVKLMRTAENENTRLAAATLIIERAHGKPRQEIEVSGQISADALSDAELLAIAAGSGAGIDSQAGDKALPH